MTRRFKLVRKIAGRTHYKYWEGTYGQRPYGWSVCGMYPIRSRPPLKVCA